MICGCLLRQRSVSVPTWSAAVTRKKRAAVFHSSCKNIWKTDSKVNWLNCSKFYDYLGLSLTPLSVIDVFLITFWCHCSLVLQQCLILDYCSVFTWYIVGKYSGDLRYLRRWQTQKAATVAALWPTLVIITCTCVPRCRPTSCCCSGTNHWTSLCCSR